MSLLQASNYIVYTYISLHAQHMYMFICPSLISQTKHIRSQERVNGHANIQNCFGKPLKPSVLYMNYSLSQYLRQQACQIYEEHDTLYTIIVCFNAPIMLKSWNMKFQGVSIQRSHKYVNINGYLYHISIQRNHKYINIYGFSVQTHLKTSCSKFIQKASFHSPHALTHNLYILKITIQNNEQSHALASKAKRHYNYAHMCQLCV